MPAKPKLPLVVFSDDEPNGDSSQDSLRLRSIAEGAAGAAISSRGPITIGTFGKWGGGRTSVLRQAQRRCSRRPIPRLSPSGTAPGSSTGRSRRSSRLPCRSPRRRAILAAETKMVAADGVGIRAVLPVGTATRQIAEEAQGEEFRWT